MAIDSHTHIYGEDFPDIKECVKRALDNNVNKMMLVGFSHETNEEVYKISLEYPHILYPTAGIHPDQVNISSEEDIVKLNQFISSHKVYALGECGLDYHYEPETKEKQKWLFEEQIKLSKKYRLPLIIHSRDAMEDTYNLLEKYANDIRFVMHCYTGSIEMALRFVKLGGMISLGGPVTFKNSVYPKEVAAKLPLDKLMIETDSPYMSPVPLRGKRNESANVIYILKYIAELRGINEKELESILDQNTIKFFNLD